MNKTFIESLKGYELLVMSEGFSIILDKYVEPTTEAVLRELNKMSDQHGGYGLVSVMDKLRNTPRLYNTLK